MSEVIDKSVKQEHRPQNRKFLKLAAIGCALLLGIVGCCVMVIILTFYTSITSGISVVKKEIVPVICVQDNSDIEEIYREKTTPYFRSTNSLPEFKSKLLKISDKECNTLKNAGFMTSLQNSWSYSSGGEISSKSVSRSLIFEGKIEDKTIKVELKNLKDEYLLDSLIIK